MGTAPANIVVIAAESPLTGSTSSRQNSRKRSATRSACWPSFLLGQQEVRARLRARYGDLLPGTMALLVDLSERSFHSDLVDLFAAVIVCERDWARQSAAAERAALAEEIMEMGEALGFPFVAIEKLDLLAGISNWSRTCEYGSLERLRQVREAVVIRKQAIERRARLARLSQS